MDQMNNQNLHTIDGHTLLNTPMEAPRFVVSSLIPSGLHILGGSPKIGKSWMMLWLCLQIAKGENVWNYQTRQGTVLYLCLEDSYERIQSRLLDITEDAPPNLHFAIMADTLAGGLDKQIENFIAAHTDTVLIVIDTLQNVRDEASGTSLYANDYRELKPLKELSVKHRVAILCVHHLRKMKDDDPMNMLSGTSGLAGIVDTVFILDREKRTENNATLLCMGRDVESAELKLRFDPDTRTWQCLGAAEEVPLMDATVCVLAEYLVSSSDFTGTATELSAEVERVTGRTVSPATLKKKLMKHHGELLERGWRFSSRRTRNEKIIEIRRVR